MALLSRRLVIPVALIVVAWGGLHLAGSGNLAPVPAPWPGSSNSPATQPTAGALPQLAASPSASTGLGSIPVLPGALRQLNGSTRDTAVGLYALIEQLEGALRSHLQQLVLQLEPGR